MAPPRPLWLAEPLSTSDGEKDPTRIGLQAEGIQAKLHGRYYEASLRGRVFIATQTAGVQIITQGGTTSSFSLANPAGSGRNLVPIRWDLVMTATPGTPVVGIYGLYVNRDPRAAAVTGTAVAEFPVLLGTNAQAVGEPLTSSTLPAAPTLIRTLGFKGTDSKKVPVGSQRPYIQPYAIDFDGSIVLAPGTALSIQQNVGDTSNGSGICSVIWEEVDIDSIAMEMR